ncbi:MAG TPA: hypothetical protein VLV82_03485 [Candidatus Angelobacter sp.]|nr:hypothetical protein [Candidatus Angelobacter sp.]
MVGVGVTVGLGRAVVGTGLALVGSGLDVVGSGLGLDVEADGVGRAGGSVGVPQPTANARTAVDAHTLAKARGSRRCGAARTMHLLTRPR